MSRPHVLLVEDDRELATLTATWLEQEDFHVSVEADGRQAAARILGEQPDVVVLDLMLPQEDGFSVCRRVRTGYQGPILVLTARRDELDQVLSLELGADDYLAKPASPRVLVARLRALLRRAHGPAAPPNRLVFDDLVINCADRSVTLSGVAVPMTTAEVDLLWVLASRAGETLDRDALMDTLRGVDYDGVDRSIDLRVSKLRKKIGDDPRQPRRIKTVWGSGYLFVRNLS